jgi:CRISPR-associated protein Csm2
MSNEQRNFNNGQKNFNGQKKPNQSRKFDPPKEPINEQNYVDIAEDVMERLKYEKGLTTSKLRNLLSMTADIYNEAMNSKEQLGSEICSRIEYLRVRFLYEAGREQAVKNFVDASGVIKYLKDIKASKKKFIVFNRYMEALIAFHKFNGGKD